MVVLGLVADSRSQLFGLFMVLDGGGGNWRHWFSRTFERNGLMQEKRGRGRGEEKQKRQLIIG